MHIKGSGSQSPHHHHTLPARNPHAYVTPEERLSRLFLFLEAQFGADNVSPIADPKLPPLTASPSSKDSSAPADQQQQAADTMSLDESPESLAQRRAAELERLHKIGIPVPGVFIRLDKMSAKVWLEDLEVESSSRVFADRVRAVVERACETIAPLWG